ncbi:cadherin-related tumor suppressor-like [Haliotis rubra]|uniref:cadherin-related tumor suppressor-like n=1 Tax=Haliotis rubra TaxID=36100 RepID=UPI001EE5051A|nr:cadherin-related tumor suppressor-like [Haliotis rubra]
MAAHVVQAQDRDSVDTSITYQIQSVSDGGAGKFTISNTNGQLLLRAVVQVGEEYTIIVNATDSTVPRRSASVLVYVTITSSGNKDPQIPAGLYTVYVSEGIDVNRDIFTIPATDPDNQALTFSIINGNNGNTFVINNNGVVSNRVTLNRETVPEYNLTITASDLGTSPASTVLRVIVTDVNDNSPVFLNSVNNRYFFNVQEGQTPPATVGSVAAVDGDQSDRRITTLVPLDYETQQQHEFTVRAIDSGASPRANVATVVVSVIDTQDSIPLFVSVDYEGSIQENLNGTSVLTVSAVDADQTDNIVYQFAGGEFQSFSINPTTGVISTVIPLDYEVKNRYLFTVTTSDGVNTNAVSSTATVTISVIDQNDFTPVLTTSTLVDTISVLENLVSATCHPPSGTQLFFINPTTGQLVLRNPFTDDPGVPTYTVTILGTNEGSPFRAGVLTLTVNVIRNTAPVFNPTTLPANIDENSINQVVSVITATATDVDTVSPFNVLTYTLRGDGPALDYFQINSASGEIQTRALLSSTTDRSFTLRVRATDGGGLFADLRIDLTVNKNLNAPTLSQQNYTETIFENRALGSVITTIRANDADRQPPHNELSYSITGDATAQQFFAVNNRGEIYLIRSPAENQAISRFNMIVDVRDQGLPTSRPANPNPVFVTINVIRNANPPIFFTREYNRVIPENTTIGQFVETVTAADADSQGNFGTLRYSIIGDVTADTYFQINQNSGIVSVRTSLTNTPINDFTVRVVAQDGGTPPRSAIALLYVTVTRNFQRPVWSSAAYTIEIPETTPVLENILRLTARDSDAQPPNNEVTYELVGDAVQLYYFEIVSSTGDIRPRRPLTSDTKRRSQFNFVVIARDKGSPPLTAAFNASVTISVFRNNNAPRFIQDPYSITVSQGLGSGTVISVRAVDDDLSTEFNQISYSIKGPANALALFTIDGLGNIQATNPAAINSASETNYKIYVRAEDNGSPRLYDIALVELTINRNLNPPIFNPVTYEETILETWPIGDVVLRVTASDADNLVIWNARIWIVYWHRRIFLQHTQV